MIQPAIAANRWNLPNLGLGLGLRGQHIAHILQARPPVDWFEVITDNHLINQGWLLHVLDRLRETYPLVLHGVTLNIGSTEPLDLAYLKQIKLLAERVRAPWVSDHVCWTGVDGWQTHDLLPVPYSEAMLRWMVQRVRQVQDILERPLVLENPSSYIAFRQTTMPEWQFLRALAEDADCGLLLDLNNIHVSAVNHGFDAQTYMDAVPWDRVAQFHVAGHTTRATHLFDSHIGPVSQPVWALYAQAWLRTGGRATLYEWDDQIPPFEDLWSEAQKARAVVADLPTAGPAERPVIVSARAPVLTAAPPTEIVQLQRWLQAEIVTGASDQPADAHVLPNAQMTAAERVAIHREMYLARTEDALRTDFPRTAAALGQRFASVAAGYRLARPSTSWALELYGAEFAAYVAVAAPRPTWLGDLARLEWARVEATLAPQVSPLEPSAIVAVAHEDQPQLRLRFGPAVQLLEFAHAVVGRQRRGAQAVVVFRRGFEVDERVVSPAEAAMLEALRSGATLGQAFAEVAGQSPKFARELTREIGHWCQIWARDGVVVGVELA